MTPRDVDIERRRALIAVVRASIVELRYIEKRQGLRPARFDGRYELNATVEVGAGDGSCTPPPPISETDVHFIRGR